MSSASSRHGMLVMDGDIRFVGPVFGHLITVSALSIHKSIVTTNITLP